MRLSEAVDHRNDGLLCLHRRQFLTKGGNLRIWLTLLRLLNHRLRGHLLISLRATADDMLCNLIEAERLAVRLSWTYLAQDHVQTADGIGRKCTLDSYNLLKALAKVAAISAGDLVKLAELLVTFVALTIALNLSVTLLRQSEKLSLDRVRHVVPLGASFRRETFGHDGIATLLVLALNFFLSARTAGLFLFLLVRLLWLLAVLLGFVAVVGFRSSFGVNWMMSSIVLSRSCL